MQYIKRSSLILRSEDAPAEVDPLSGAASGFEAPKYPVLAADRIVRFKVKKASKDSVKEDKDKPNPRQMLVLHLVTTKEYPDKDGQPLREGFSVYKRIGLFEIKGEEGKRDRTMKDHVGPELAELLRAMGKSAVSPRDLVNNPAMIEGEVVDCKSTIIPAKGEFPETNGVKFVQPA